MLSIQFIKENRERVEKSLENRNKKADLDKLIKLDDKRKALLTGMDQKRSEQKQLSSPPAGGGARGGGSDKARALKEEIKEMEKKLSEVMPVIDVMLSGIPNVAYPDVPVGKDENDNELMREIGEPTKLDFEPKDHLELGEPLGIIDTERASKVSGSRFAYLIGGAARIQMALIQYTFDLLTKEGFIPIIPPVIVKRETASGSGHPEATGDEAYHLDQDDMFLVGTSEQSILPMYKDEILSEKDLPLRYVGYSTCFRREAGSYGKDTKGILRQHQFDKLEMFVYCKPEDSEKEHENLLRLEEELMKGLELPYRVMKLSTGDLGFPSAKTYDIETWIPSQNKYRETHSTSNCTDFQSRGLNIRYRPAVIARNEAERNDAAISSKKGTEFVHTLNGTAFAIGRTLIAIMENNQNKDGSITVPKALQKYCGLEVIK